MCGPFYAPTPRKMPLLLLCRSKKASKRISVPLLQINDKSLGALISEACKLCWQCETWGRGAEKDDFKKPQKPQQSGEGNPCYFGVMYPAWGILFDVLSFFMSCPLNIQTPDMNQTQHTTHHLLIIADPLIRLETKFSRSLDLSSEVLEDSTYHGRRACLNLFKSCESYT